MLNLISIEIENLFAIEKANIKFGTKSGLHIIYGIKNGDANNSNGTGKSSIIESINWVLFDKISKNIAASDIVREGCNRGGATLHFKTDRNSYEVQKWRKGGNISIKLFENGKDISYRDSNTTKKYILRVIQMDFELWSNTIVINQDSTGILFDGTDKDRKDMFIRLLKLYSLDTSLKYVRETISKFNGKIGYYQGKLSGTNLMEIKEINPLLYDRKIKQLTAKRLSVGERVLKYSRLYSKYANLRDGFDSKIDELSRNLSKYNKSLKNNTCPYCGQTLKSINKLKSDIEQCSKQLEISVSELKKTEISSNEYSASEERYRNLSEKLTLKLDRLKSTLTKFRQADKHNSQVDNIREGCVAVIGKLERKIETYKKLEEIFGVNGYRKHLIETTIEMINKEMNAMLSGVIDVSTELYIDGSKFDMNICRDKQTRGKESLSGGERRLVSIIFNIAAVNVLIGRNINCLFYDEVLAQLDEKNSFNVINSLNDISKQLGLSIYLITNQKHLVEKAGEYASGTIVVKNKNGKSIVKQETR